MVAKFRHKLEKVEKTPRTFGYDLNQIPDDYAVEMTNRFKGFDLIECLENYGNIEQEVVIKTTPKKKKCKCKMVV